MTKIDPGHLARAIEIVAASVRESYDVSDEEAVAIARDTVHLSEDGPTGGRLVEHGDDDERVEAYRLVLNASEDEIRAVLQPPHPREEFDMYGQLLDLGDWSYVLDDTGVRYGSGWYPYDKSVRLSPDVEFRSWRNEYVLVSWTEDPAVVKARLKLATRKHGMMGAMVVRVQATLNLEHGTVTLHPDDLTGELLHQAQTKARRIIDLFAAERARRDTPRKRLKPVTAADLQERRERDAR